MNFFDLCVAIGRAIGRACAACWRVFERMVYRRDYLDSGDRSGGIYQPE